MSMRILLIGSLPPPIGGTSVSLLNLFESMRQKLGVEVFMVNTSGIRAGGVISFFRFFSALAKTIRLAYRVDVITLHVNLTALALIGPLVVVSAKLLHKPILVRRFNGRDHTTVKGLKFKFVDWTIRHSDLYLVQTKKNIQTAHDLGLRNVAWFPTSRKKSVEDAILLNRKRCEKLVFLSHVRPDKGIPEILLASRRLPSYAKVDVYGPLLHGLSVEDLSGCPNLRYCGIVEPSEIASTLQKYDALLLPTYCEGEGYPGVILEAFGAGIPVIATQWGGIPEIVDDTCGILVAPRDAAELYHAIHRLCSDDILYAELCKGALARQKMFDLNFWTTKFVEYCGDLVTQERKWT